MKDAKVKIIKKEDYEDGSYFIELDVNFTNLNATDPIFKKDFESLEITRNTEGEITIRTLAF